jgi:hypothetical protein
LGYSHSIVAGGFPEMSYFTREMPFASLMMRRAEFVDEDPVRLAQQVRVLLRHLAKDAHAEPGPQAATTRNPPLQRRRLMAVPMPPMSPVTYASRPLLAMARLPWSMCVERARDHRVLQHVTPAQ